MLVKALNSYYKKPLTYICYIKTLIETTHVFSKLKLNLFSKKF